MMARAVGGKKFDKIMVSRTYFGNWLRDYSQAIDVGTVKSVSAEAIRLLLCILGFLTFGFGSREFEVTADRLGCYRPEGEFLFKNSLSRRGVFFLIDILLTLLLLRPH